MINCGLRHLPQVEAWGGAEYTFNRVGDCYFDQMDFSGHAHRIRDVEMFADMGIRALRCGLLWERQDLDPSWRWPDAYLGALRSAGVRPIAGLVHHGSGPRNTSLLDPEFSTKLASYAADVAARYPWLDAYTPVNEPNTTARFACRYGIWYPHQRSKESYLRALLNQVKAVVLSMRAIRKIRSDAQLIQTDDLGKVWSTAELALIGDLLNERRWLPFDLLCGSVNRTHPMYEYLLHGGIDDRDICWFADNPCPPDVVGINYYVTSDRFLDHRLHLYPENCHSAEGAFVDVEAVRVRPDGIQGFETILVEAYERYHLPVAITEVHLGDMVDQQIRWAVEGWKGAQRAQLAGVECRAVTFWALLGSYFWNSLVTAHNGHYESGVFDMRSGTPAATDLAEVVRQCARGDNPSHPALQESGWWHKSSRIQYGPQVRIAA